VVLGNLGSVRFVIQSQARLVFHYGLGTSLGRLWFIVIRVQRFDAEAYEFARTSAAETFMVFAGLPSIFVSPRSSSAFG